MKLYDIVNLYQTQFTQKEMVTAKSANPSPGAARNTATISANRVANAGQDVKRLQSS